MHYPDRIWTTLSIVEPEDSALLQMLSYSDSLPNRPEWSRAVQILRENRSAMNPMQDFAFLSGQSDTFLDQTVDSAAVAFRDEIRLLAKRQGDSAALWTLEHDRTSDNRVIAAFMLGHFSDKESTWWTLVRALRGPSDLATSMAEMVLSALTRAEPRQVDWAPVEEDLRFLLGGTNLFAYIMCCRRLLRRASTPKSARNYLRQVRRC